MDVSFSRRDLFKTVAAGATLALAESAQAGDRVGLLRRHAPGWVTGHLTGAQALVEALIAEGADCVFGIPGAQENELWDAFKSKGLGYLLVTHEFSASTMADGYARSTGRPGVICIVPGPGVTNCLTGVGEALLDSVPMVCVVGDVARGERYRPFQVHELPQAALLQPVCKHVLQVQAVGQVVDAIRQAFHLAVAGEPGPVAVVVPYNLLIESHKFHSAPLAPPALPFDEAAYARARCLLGERRTRVGLYVGYGCMDYGGSVARVAELLQAPVATSVSGKGVLPEDHPLAVGWGYGPQGTGAAEEVFKHVDLVLAVGVRYSEVSTAFYNIPKHRVIHVDVNPDNLGRIVKPEVCVHADAGLFLERLLADADCLRRECDPRLAAKIQKLRAADRREYARRYARCGADPVAFLLTLRCQSRRDALAFVDVTTAEHWAAEAFTVCQARTYFNPTNNQAMGWAIGAALGAQRAHPGRQVVAVTGDGCFLMSAMEISTAARECLPVKFFVLDDQAYNLMQVLQKPAYGRTTATILARLDYEALAKGFGVAYQEILSSDGLEGGIAQALAAPGPVLTRVATDYRKRPIRWVEATRDRFVDELSAQQKVRFLARLGARSLDPSKEND